MQRKNRVRSEKEKNRTRERALEYYYEHRDKILNERKRFYSENKEIIKQRHRDYHAKHRERLNEVSRQWSKKNRRMIRDKINDLRRLVIEKYGGKCSCCDEVGYPFLTLDHIHNGKQNPAKRQSRNVFLKLLLEKDCSDWIRVLCYNCNLAREFSGNGVCPHKLNGSFVAPNGKVYTAK